MARITLENLAHSYLPHPKGEADFALKAIDHVWQDGGAYALLGASGCGKTTLLNIISGLVIPSQGRVLFGDRDVTRAPTAARDIAQVFQFPVVYDTMTVRQNLAFPLRNRGRDAAYIRDRVQAIARMIGMEARLDRRAQGLTADDKQKISLGRGMVREDVNAILFDEPLTVIDPQMKWELRTQLKRLHRQFGHTMIYVTHDQTEALTFAQKVVVMHEGRVVQIGTPQELFETPAHAFVGYFIGSPGMNFFDAAVEGRMARLAGGTVDLGAAYPAGPGRIGIRPEHARLVAGGLPVVIRRVEDVGRSRLVRAELAGQPLAILLPEGAPIPAEPTVAFDPRRIGLYRNDWRVAPEAGGGGAGGSRAGGAIDGNGTGRLFPARADIGKTGGPSAGRAGEEETGPRLSPPLQSNPAAPNDPPPGAAAETDAVRPAAESDPRPGADPEIMAKTPRPPTGAAPAREGR